MPETEAHKRGKLKWDKENMVTLSARVTRKRAEKYRKRAEALGKSMNLYIIDLLERDAENGGD